MAGIVGTLHQTLVFGRRARVLSDQLAALVPPAARILDVGCGDGRSALTAIHPGEHLAEELEALDMSAAELARKIKVATNRITQISNGTRAITGCASLISLARALSFG